MSRVVYCFFVSLFFTSLQAQKAIEIPPELPSQGAVRAQLSSLYESGEYEDVIREFSSQWNQLNDPERVHYLAAEVLWARRSRDTHRLWSLLELTENLQSLGEPARSQVRFIICGLLKSQVVRETRR